MDRPLIVLDTETTGLRGAPHLIELGAVRIVDGDVADQFESLVRPEVPIEPEAHAIHGIGHDDVADAPPAGEVLARFREWAGEDWLAAHNAPFDARVLAYECGRSGVEPPPGPFLDSLRLSRRFLPDAPDHTLATLSQMLELEDGPHHRALSDAVYCWKVIEACLEVARRPDPEGAPREVGLDELLSLCGRPVSVPGAMPPAPRLPRRLRGIEAALNADQPVTLQYGAGLEPPARLEVWPRFLFRWRDKDYLEAECQRSGSLKTYRLDRVQRILR